MSRPPTASSAPSPGRSGPGAHLPPSPPPPAIYDHELLKRIGGGGYGEVWLARSVVGSYRAVKIVHRHNFDHDRPFEREFAGIQKFEPISRSHEGLVDLLQVGRNDAEGYFYYVMELADAAQPQVEAGRSKREDGRGAPDGPGHSPSSILDPQYHAPRTLASEIRSRSRLPLDECIQLGLSLTDALAYLHRQGLVHRDIKPSNIIFVGGVPKLADVGLVTGVDEARSYVGTEGFIPPEGPGTLQADLYSLGIMLYQMSTGKSHQDFPEPLPDLAAQPDHTRWLEFNAVIHKACAANPRERYQSAEEMRVELHLLKRGQSVKRRHTVQERLRALRKIGIVAAAVILVAAASVFLWQTIRRHNAPFILADTPYGNISTTAPEAAVACRRGCQGLRKGTTKGFHEAREAFTAATNADPQCLFAHARLFETYLMSEDADVSSIDSKAENLGTLATNLWKLSPTNAETHAALAIVLFLNEWKWNEAESQFKEALAADPNCRMALVYYGYMLTRQLRAGPAREVLQRADKLDPESLLITKFLGHCEYVERDYVEALKYYRRASEWEENYPGSHEWAGRALWALAESHATPDKIEYHAALDEVEKFEGIQDPSTVATLRVKYQKRHDILDKDGTHGYWLNRLETVDGLKSQVPYWYAECHARAGHKAEALAGLKEALKQRDTMENLLVDEFWDDYRNEPTFKEVQRTVGLDKWAR